ncbi:HNH endonuclease family protein [Chitinophaga rhizophila]|uniref:TIGR02646 family protein n=1 Tax=Chitinophaga rhizophila TaxID=2866212 RepID=A0ABS7GK69_9BACT|nr:hypothetical protein [Chitinophaga rhizophila]MBW8688114.1 hypothetical protein [Chitinophaga rhizophila]
MIQIVRKTALPVPAILQQRGREATDALLERHNNGERNFASKVDFDSKIYGHHTVKNALRDAQSHKCCFCESRISHISHGDVEHYRPKTAWVQDSEPFNRPGYYWLAYDWDNLLLSCQLCNERHKKNYFPLQTPSNRALSHQSNISLEEPLFIHPVLEDPARFITFREEVTVAINGNDRGTVTIERLGLTRPALNESRREILALIRTVYDMAKGFPEAHPEGKQEARDLVKRYYDESQVDDTQYAGMRRAFFQQHPLENL